MHEPILPVYVYGFDVAFLTIVPVPYNWLLCCYLHGYLCLQRQRCNWL